MDVIDRVGELIKEPGNGRECWYHAEDATKQFRIWKTLPSPHGYPCKNCVLFGDERSPIYVLEGRIPGVEAYLLLEEHRSLGCASVELTKMFRKSRVKALNELLKK